MMTLSYRPTEISNSSKKYKKLKFLKIPGIPSENFRVGRSGIPGGLGKELLEQFNKISSHHASNEANAYSEDR